MNDEFAKEIGKKHPNKEELEELYKQYPNRVNVMFISDAKIENNIPRISISISNCKDINEEGTNVTLFTRASDSINIIETIIPKFCIQKIYDKDKNKFIDYILYNEINSFKFYLSKRK